MLGKLIKNDFKSSSHLVAWIYLAAFVISGITALSYYLDITWVIALGTMALVFMAIGIIIVTLVSVVINFNRTLYGNQGYLSFTLPVKISQLLFSKTIVSFVWILLSYLMGIGIFALIVEFFKQKIGEETLVGITAILNMMSSFPSTAVLLKIIITLIIYFFTVIIILISEIFFAITLSNIRPFQQMGAFGGIVAFLVIYLSAQGIGAVLTMYVPLSLVISTEGMAILPEAMMGSEAVGSTVIGLTGFLFQVIVAIVLFVATNYLMKKKVNLK